MSSVTCRSVCISPCTRSSAALIRRARRSNSSPPGRAGFARFDLSAVAATVAEVYAPAAEERGQALATEIAPGLELLGDRELITQMLANLVDNAVKHGRAGGRVALLLAPGRITVEDDGPGIPTDQREAVLRRFHRLDAARATPGSGLGLALVAAIAELHGMRLKLANARQGLRVTLDWNGRSGGI
jgi:signal transduction histidine kinase